jgi:hypothetical protein
MIIELVINKKKSSVSNDKACKGYKSIPMARKKQMQ